ncbi:MAG: DUF1800 family protein [Rhodoplanes sp.]
MAIDPNTRAALMLHRFGFGPRRDGIAAIASDPHGALLAELDRPGGGRLLAPNLLTSGEAGRAAFEFRQERRAERRAAREAEQASPSAGAAPSMGAPDGSSGDGRSMQAMQNPGPGVPQQLYLEEARVRIDAALRAEIGFVERLVWFWSNHFCISADKGPGVRALAGAFEREAIRPHVLGRFADMLIAVETHPAMLRYLDNVRSIGPNSIVGRNRNAGLNENLAREILELHTLGVRSVYTQADVTSFARVITGWSVVPFQQDPQRGGEFVFNPRLHEPGAQSVIGRSYRAAGMEQGLVVLRDLARHPATAKHVAQKIAIHFVSDTPPPAFVDRLAKRFLDTQGDLKELAKALVASTEAWDAPREKLKRPGEWIVGALRATGYAPPDVRPVVQAQNLLGEPLWRPPAPKGFSDATAAWMDGLSQRLDIANQLSRRVGSLVDPADAIDMALGPLASADTRRAVARAESRSQALTLLLMSPEFQRR